MWRCSRKLSFRLTELFSAPRALLGRRGRALRALITVGLGSVFLLLWNVVQWPVLFCEVLLAFSLVYYFAPDVEQRFRWISLGSIIAVTLWIVFSILFALYVNNFGSYNATYGSLAGVAIFLFYIYYSALIMLVGAEMNQVIEGHIPEGKDEGEKTIDADQ